MGFPNFVVPARTSGGQVTERIGSAAILALLSELSCYPKPGLVSFVDQGAHEDMNAGTFLLSINVLQPYFPAIAQAGAVGAPLTALRALGIEAERRMLAATAGINTHRGAIFALGLLAAAAGRLAAAGGRLTPEQVAGAVRIFWGRELEESCSADTVEGESHGAWAARLYGVGGARSEARAGFPTLRQTVLPGLAAARKRGLPPCDAAVDAFFASLAVLDDTNLLYRGGPEGLAFMQNAAARVVAAGGVTAQDGRSHAIALHETCSRHRLSPSGSADMLAAALFLERLDR